jgi:replicative DNA helicase
MERLSKLPIGVTYQKMLIKGIIQDPHFGRMTVDYLRPEYFDTDGLQWLFSSIQETCQKLSIIPTYRLLDDQATQVKDTDQANVLRMLIAAISEMDFREFPYVQEKVTQFIRMNMAVDAFGQSVGFFQAGDMDGFTKSLAKFLAEDQRVQDPQSAIHDFFAETPQRHLDRVVKAAMSEYLPTGIDRLDRVLGGGVEKGRLSCVMAPTGRGKSTFLCHVGVKAIQYRQRVFHVFLEGMRDEFEARYDAILSKTPYSTIMRAEYGSDVKQRLERNREQYPAMLMTRGASSKTYNPRMLLDDLKRLWDNYGWKPDAVIVDYGDLMAPAPGTTTRNEWLDQGLVFEQLKNHVAIHGPYYLWTAAQTQRLSEADERTGMPLTAHRIEGGKVKLNKLDYLVSINQTEEEKDQGIGKMALVKGRSVATVRPFRFKVDLATMMLGDLPDHQQNIPMNDAPVSNGAPGRPVQKQGF